MQVVTDKDRQTLNRIAKSPESTELNEHMFKETKRYIMGFIKINYIYKMQRYIIWCNHNIYSQICLFFKSYFVTSSFMLEKAKQCLQHIISADNVYVQWEMYNGMGSHILEIIRSVNACTVV